MKIQTFFPLTQAWLSYVLAIAINLGSACAPSPRIAQSQAVSMSESQDPELQPYLPAAIEALGRFPISDPRPLLSFLQRHYGLIVTTFAESADYISFCNGILNSLSGESPSTRESCQGRSSEIGRKLFQRLKQASLKDRDLAQAIPPETLEVALARRQTESLALVNPERQVSLPEESELAAIPFGAILLIGCGALGFMAWCGAPDGGACPEWLDNLVGIISITFLSSEFLGP